MIKLFFSPENGMEIFVIIYGAAILGLVGLVVYTLLLAIKALKKYLNS
jgi:hypothetical protein